MCYDILTYYQAILGVMMEYPRMYYQMRRQSQIELSVNNEEPEFIPQITLKATEKNLMGSAESWTTDRISENIKQAFDCESFTIISFPDSFTLEISCDLELVESLLPRLQEVLTLSNVGDDPCDSH